MRIRRALQSDLGVLLDLDPRAASGDADRRSYLRLAVDGDACFLALDDHRPSGFVVIKPGHFFGRNFVDLLMAAETCRRRGVGTALLRTALAEATTTDVFTSTNESNKPMRALLESEDWRFSGKLNGLDDDPELVFYKRH